MTKSATNVNLSYWEINQYFSVYDLIVVGSGIVGLFSALSYKKQNKKAKVLVLESGILPHGASTKNAGFACFGSISELSADLLTMKERDVWDTVSMRWNGLHLLRTTLGDESIAFKNWGGYELFDSKSQIEVYMDSLKSMNKNIEAAIGRKNCYSLVNSEIKHFGFNNVKGLIKNKYEGQLDTGKMMSTLIKLVQKNNITILNGVKVEGILDSKNKVNVNTNLGEFTASKVIVATNGFAKELLNIKDVQPARAQVLITKPIKGLKIRGTFHYHQGFYYFRNINGRLLLGGARNIDLKNEMTSEFKITKKIQNQLEFKLKDMILPKTPFEIEHRWVGIMGVGSEKKPIIKHVSQNVVAAVRMGGMGVAIGSMVGLKAAELIRE